MNTISLWPWMLVRGDIVNIGGEWLTLQHEPTYTDATKQNHRLYFTNGTSVVVSRTDYIDVLEK